MNLTIGFIAFFISIIIPGILFRRFYFYGEFSKQFNTKDPVLHSMFFSIIPGICLQVIGFLFYHLALDFEGSFLDIFIVLRDITSDGSTGTTEITQNFINKHLLTYFLYTIVLLFLSAVLGYVLSRFIRWRKWDKKFKLFRFKNQWYYIFSGEVLNMKKFEEAHKVNIKNKNNFDQEISTTYADVLINTSEGVRELYTGYVVDYDLNSEDITKLDKIYLLDAHRYKRTVCDTTKKVSTEQKGIPGDVFILNAENIININLTYIPSSEKGINAALKKQKKYNRIILFQFVLLLTFILLHFIYKYIGLGNTFFEEYITTTNFVGKIITILFINQFVAFFCPTKGKQEKLSYNTSELGIRIASFVLLGILTYYFGIGKIL